MICQRRNLGLQCSGGVICPRRRHDLSVQLMCSIGEEDHFRLFVPPPTDLSFTEETTQKRPSPNPPAVTITSELSKKQKPQTSHPRKRFSARFLLLQAQAAIGEPGQDKGRRSPCMPERWKRMKGEEEDELWEKDENVTESGQASKAQSSSNSRTTPGTLSLEEEPPGSVASLGGSSTGSGHAQVLEEVSEEEASSGGAGRTGGVHIHTGSQQMPHEGEEQPSSSSGTNFLFIGPVGKKRLRCRERRASADTEGDVLSPSSVLSEIPTPDPMSSEPDPPPLVEETSEDSIRSRGSGSAPGHGGHDEPGGPSTPASRTSVIRPTPRTRRGEEQPLNLSLPIETQAEMRHSYVAQPVLRLHSVPPMTSQTQTQTGNGRRASVINIASTPRERHQEEQGPSTPSSNRCRCPSECSQHQHQHQHHPHHQEEPQRYSGNLVPSWSQGTSGDFFSISSGSGFSTTTQTSPGPSSFHGLLRAHSIDDPHPNETISEEANDKKKFTCRDCGKSFSQQRNYRYHRSRHEGTNQFACTCPVCGKSFNDKGYLSSHLKIHKNEKEYKCEFCGKCFNQRVAYNMHKRIHTGFKPHCCELCPKTFSRKMLLRQHIRTHTGERPYECAVCGKRFADRSNMLLHQRLHTGDRPYKCHICGKCFSKNHHLKTHLNHHAGIKPYRCDKCNQSFSQSSNMKTHHRKCTGGGSAGISAGPSSSSSTPATTRSFQSSPTPSQSSRTSMVTSTVTITQPQTTFMMTELQEAIMFQQEQQQQRLRQLQPDQFLGLSPVQQHQLLQDVSTSLMVPSPLHSPPSRSASASGNSYGRSLGGHPSSPQSLGYSLGSLSLNSPTRMPTRTRRTSGHSLVPLGNLSPTSLAAGHPFIPLTALESVGLGHSLGTSHLSPSSPSISSPPSMFLVTPRNQHHADETDSVDMSQFPSSLTQSVSSQQRTSRGASQTVVSQEQHDLLELQQQHSERSSPGRSLQHHGHPRLSPHGIPAPRLSPTQRHSQMLQGPQAQSPPEYYEMFLPSIPQSRAVPQLSPRQTLQLMEHQQMYQQQGFGGIRPQNFQDFQRMFRISSPGSSSSRPHSRGSQSYHTRSPSPQSPTERTSRGHTQTPHDSRRRPLEPSTSQETSQASQDREWQSSRESESGGISDKPYFKDSHYPD